MARTNLIHNSSLSATSPKSGYLAVSTPGYSNCKHPHRCMPRELSGPKNIHESLAVNGECCAGGSFDELPDERTAGCGEDGKGLWYRYRI